MDTSVSDLDLASLLAPLPGDRPAGHDPRRDVAPQAPYRQLRAARNAAREAERAAEQGTEADTGRSAPSQWQIVRQLATGLLVGTCKDLEVAAWLTEALVRADPLEGLSGGARLLAGLVREYWDRGLLPPLDEDGAAGRTAAVQALGGGRGTLIQPLYGTVLFRRADLSAVTLYMYSRALELRRSADPQRVGKSKGGGAVPFEVLESEARAAGEAAFVALRDGARGALAAWQDMADAFYAAAGTGGPATGPVREVLEQIVDAARQFGPADEPPAPAATPAATPATTAETEMPAASRVAALGVAASAERRAPEMSSREDMLRELDRIAAYFRRTEPHSPLSYTLAEAVRRGRMALPDLLAELVPDEAARGTILSQLGIRQVKP